MNKEVKCVVVGDGSVGKTSVLTCYALGVFQDDCRPTVFDNYSATVVLDGKPITLAICDTAGGDDYDRSRPLAYPDTHIFLVCFSLVRRESYENVSLKWIKEIQQHAPNAPLILVGTKLDMRKGTQSTYVTYEEGLSLSKSIKAKKYFECSAKTREGLKQVFEETVRQALKPITPTKPLCWIL